MCVLFSESSASAALRSGCEFSLLPPSGLRVDGERRAGGERPASSPNANKTTGREERREEGSPALPLLRQRLLPLRLTTYTVKDKDQSALLQPAAPAHHHVDSTSAKQHQHPNHETNFLTANLFPGPSCCNHRRAVTSRTSEPRHPHLLLAVQSGPSLRPRCIISIADTSLRIFTLSHPDVDFWALSTKAQKEKG